MPLNPPSTRGTTHRIPSLHAVRTASHRPHCPIALQRPTRIARYARNAAHCHDNVHINVGQSMDDRRSTSCGCPLCPTLPAMLALPRIALPHNGHAMSLWPPLPGNGWQCGHPRGVPRRSWPGMVGDAACDAAHCPAVPLQRAYQS